VRSHRLTRIAIVDLLHFLLGEGFLSGGRKASGCGGAGGARRPSLGRRKFGRRRGRRRRRRHTESFLELAHTGSRRHVAGTYNREQHRVMVNNTQQRVAVERVMILKSIESSDEIIHKKFTCVSLVAFHSLSVHRSRSVVIQFMYSLLNHTLIFIDVRSGVELNKQTLRITETVLRRFLGCKLCKIPYRFPVNQ